MATPDVAVIGGGIVGVATAVHLAAGGATVRLYERESIAAAASGRNSGAIQYPFDPVLQTLYEESIGLYRELAEEDGAFELADRPAGMLFVGFEGARLERLAAALAGSHPALRPTFLDDAAVRALEPEIAPGVLACRVEMGFPVGPREATLAYARRAEQLGVGVVLGGEARPAIREGRVAGVERGGRVDPAGTVVVAAGPWTPELVDPAGTWRPIRPLWGVVVSLSLPRPPRHILEEAAIDIEPDGTAQEGAPDAIDFSLMTAGSASTLGSTFLAAQPDPVAFRHRIVAHGQRFVPAVGSAAELGLRACARPLSFDGRPLLGAVSGVDGLWVAAGHGPWGISTGPASGRIVADLVLGRADGPPTGLDASRYTPAPSGQRQLSGSNK
jgi:glycine/D-amino acid oxidase-like deaminating enzyme